jgi:hypothetical protein
MPQLSTQGGQDSGGKVIKISQINYGKFLSGGIITIRFSVKLLYTVLIIIALLVLAAVGLIIIMRRRKRDKELEALYKQLMKAEDMNELYNCFNSIMKYCFGINLKAASRDSLEERFRDFRDIKPELSREILNTMEDMESKTAGIQDIRNNIKLIYKALRNRRNPTGHFNLNKV